MQNKEGQVLFHKKNFGPFWTEGKLRQTEFSLVVSSHIFFQVIHYELLVVHLELLLVVHLELLLVVLHELSEVFTS